MNSSIPKKLAGRYFPTGTSASHHALLEGRGEKLAVTGIEGADDVLVQFAELGDRLGNLPRKIYFTDGSVFECPENDAVDLVFGKDKHLSSRLTKLEGSWKFVLAACVATVILIAGIYRYGLPVAANFAAWATPSSAVALIDDGALDTVDRVMFNPSAMGEDDRARYTSLFAELVEASGNDPSNIKLLFRDGGRLGANAVALPGGTVILTDQLAELAENDDEIAGVLAHEIGHVFGRHSLRQIYRALGIGFMVAIVIGDTSQLLDNVVGQLALLDTLSYSRQFETDADSTSVKIMLKAGRDPVAFVDLLDRVFGSIGVDGNEKSWLSTHPGNDNRRENVKKQVERLK